MVFKKGNQYAKGNHPRSEFKKGHKESKETSEKRSITAKKNGIGKWMLGRKLSQETIEKVRKALTGRPCSLETRKKISESQIGKKLPIEQIIKIANSKRGKPTSWKGGHHSEQTKVNMSKSAKKRVYSKEMELQRNSKISNNSKRMWNNHKNRQIKLILNGLMKRPTSYEQKISNLCFKYNLPFVYKGDGDFLINFKNPDFVNEQEKVVIEVFYSYFKIRDYGSVENYKDFCKEKYNSAGWKVIFIDENDLNCKNWEEVCLNKINSMEVIQ